MLTLLQAHDNASSFGGDASNIYAIGVSAGAGLALSLTRKIVLGQSRLESDAVKGLVLFCPVVLHPDNIPGPYSTMHKSSVEYRQGVPLMDGNALRLCFDLAGLDATNEDYFLAHPHESHRYLPPAYLSTCDKDSLRDDGAVLKDLFKRAGIEVKANFYPGQPHCFWIVPNVPESDKFMEDAFAGVEWVINQM